MPVVCAAAAAEHVDARKAVEQFGIERAELFGIAGVEFGRIVELGMTHARGIGPQPAQTSRQC
jgi:hypothetical protein